MKTFLENKSFNVKDGKKTYKVYAIETFHGYDWVYVNLRNVDDEDDEVQEICYIMVESITECLEANGYKILKERKKE